MKLTNNSLLKLLIAAGIMVALAIIINLKPERADKSFHAGSLLIQGIEPSKIAKIILNKEGFTSTINRVDNGFVLLEKENYPADIEDINHMLISMLDIRLASRAATELTEKNSVDFNLDEPATIELFDDSGKSIIKLQSGDNSANGTFVSLGKEVYISDKVFEFSAKPIDYVNQSLLSLNPTDVDSIQVSKGTGKFSFANENDSLKLTAIPKDKEEDSNKVWGFKSAVTRLNFTDLQKSKEFKPAGEITLTMKSGLKYSIKYNAESKVEVSATPPSHEMVQKSMQIRADSDKKELAAKDAVLQAVGKAKEFNALHNGWSYTIADYEFKKLDISQNDLLKDKPAAEKSPAESKNENKQPAANITKPKPAN